MVAKQQREWDVYAVGEPNPRRTNADCCPLDVVYHICHVSDAYRIFEDRRIRSSLVWDESKLSNTRTCIAWLSPNTWANGSIYGNIRFEFEWKDLIFGKKFYWVEDMPKYRPPAYRILITDKEPTIKLDRYDPETSKGPLWYDAKKKAWYCNQEYTGEFMLDEDLWLPKDECKAVSFVTHHDSICKGKVGCDERGQERYEAGAKLLSRLIAQNVIRPNDSLRRVFLDGQGLHRDAKYAWERILRSFSRAETNGQMTHKDSPASPIVTAMLDRLATGRSLKQLGSLFRNNAELELTLRHRAAKAFGIPVDKVPGSEDE
jgi:hypothetical protein